jgi:hypothetical protein
MPDYTIVKCKKTPRFVAIEKGNRYTQYIGKIRNICVDSSAPLSRRDLEAYRLNPVAFMALEDALDDGGDVA